jgi:putative membrane protein
MQSRTPTEQHEQPIARARDATGAGEGVAPVARESIEPDARFTFANERTLLAWNRTSLALIAGGLAVAQFISISPRGIQLVVALPMIVFGAYMSYSSFHHWRLNERALRQEEPLPPSGLPRMLVSGIAVFSVAAIVLAIAHFT